MNRFAGRLGTCARCGGEILDGDFCYRLAGRYWCSSCVNDAAVIAREPVQVRRNREIRVIAQRRAGRYEEKEWYLTGWKGSERICRK